MKITIKEIAARAGVSKATVSRVLNQSKSVSEPVRERVQAVIDDCQFKPSAMARGLSTNKSHLIGIILPDLSNPVFSRMIAGMEASIRDKAYSLLIMATDFKVENKIQLIEILKDKGVDGLVLVTDHGTQMLFETLKNFARPTVIIGAETPIPEIPVIRIDNYLASREAVQYLIHAGHQKIAMIHGPLDDPQSGLARFMGFKDVMVENGLFDDHLTIGSWYGFEQGYHAMAQLLTKPNLPTAVFCACDLIAIGAMKAAMENGISVPAQMAFVGFDDVDVAKMYNPSLTTVRQPFEEKGRLAITELIELIERYESGEPLEKAACKVLAHKFVLRESSRTTIVRP